MSLVVLLDASPLGLVTNPRESSETLACGEWIDRLLSADARVIVPEIADYEVRRDLLRAGRTRGLRRLDVLKITLDNLPITTSVMLSAAEFWARARRMGRPATGDVDLDCDMILAAQATSVAINDDQVIVATNNIRLLSLFVDARHWRDINP